MHLCEQLQMDLTFNSTNCFTALPVANQNQILRKERKEGKVYRQLLLRKKTVRKTVLRTSNNVEYCLANLCIILKTNIQTN